MKLSLLNLNTGFSGKSISAFSIGSLLIFLAGCSDSISSNSAESYLEAERVVRSAYGTLEELFQTEIINIGLEELGYAPVTGSELEYDVIHHAIAQNYLDYTAVHWNPLHDDFFENNGGSQNLTRTGSLIREALQGYLVDKKTSDLEDITNIEQLKDPDVAQLFDTDGNGKANLVGCPPGWGCRDVIESHLEKYMLRETVEHDDSNYFALIESTIQLFDMGKPVLYYTWTPLWVSGVLIPDEDVIWLEVPSIEESSSSNSNNKNLGFEVNQIQVLANNQFLIDNPVAAHWFELVSIPITDVSLQNKRMKEGENTPSDIREHAEEWVRNNRGTFEKWLEQARTKQ